MSENCQNLPLIRPSFYCLRLSLSPRVAKTLNKYYVVIRYIYIIIYIYIYIKVLVMVMVMVNVKNL